MQRPTNQQRQIFPEPARGRISLPQLPDMYIHLPKTQPSRKIIFNSPQQSGESQYKLPFHQEDTPRFQEQFSTSQQGSGLLVSQSSLSRHIHGSKSDKQIILDWVKNIMERRGLLGLHWEEGLSKKRSQAQLNTQSRHNRPTQRKQNHLVFQGLEKASNILGSQIYTIKRQAFANIKRCGLSINMPHNNLAQHLLANEKESIYIWQGKQGGERVISETFAKRLLSPRVNKKEATEAVQLQKIKSAQHLNYIANQYALSPIPVFNANPEIRRRKKINQSQPQCIILAKTIQINHTTNNSYAGLKTESKDTSGQREAHQHFQKQYLPLKIEEIRRSNSKFISNNKIEQTRPQSQQPMQLRSHQVSQLRLPQSSNTVKQGEIRVRPVSASPNVSIKISYMGQQPKYIAPSRSNDCFNQYYAQSKKNQQAGMMSPKRIIQTGSQSGTSSPSARYGFDRLSGFPTPISTPSSTPNPKSPQRKSIQQSPFPSASRG